MGKMFNLVSNQGSASQTLWDLYQLGKKEKVPAPAWYAEQRRLPPPLPTVEAGAALENNVGIAI